MSGSPTPILDREAPVPAATAPPVNLSKPRRIKTVIFLTLILVGFLIALFDASPIHLFRGKARLLVAVWALIVAPLLIALSVLVVHELGHLIAGWCMGFRFLSVRVLSLRIQAPLAVSFVDNRETEYAGLTQMLPIGSKAFKARVVLMTLGGPVANLLSSVAVVPFIATVPLAGWFMVWSFFTGLINLFPFSRGASRSDGKRILMLFGKSVENKRRIALMKIVADLAKGLAPSDIDPTLISTATAAADHSIVTYLTHWVAYNAAWDAAPQAEVARLLEISLQNSDLASPKLRDALFADAGTFQAQKRKNIDLAVEWLEEIPEKPATPWARLWVETAILEVQGRFKEALAKLDEIEAMRDKRKVRGESGRNAIQRWRSKLLEKDQRSLAAGSPM